MNVCTITYSPAPVQAEATLVEVTFKKECNKQMVTVCQPQSGYQSHGYGGYNKGEKIKLKGGNEKQLYSHDI